MRKNNYKFIDLFSGCGGLSFGLEKAGHKCILGVDQSKDAIETFACNHPNAHAIHADIHKFTKTKLEKLINVDDVDMVVGGPPCQGFSTVGKGDANDLRNSLFQQFVRIVRITSPKIIIFENVTGMLAKKNELILKRIFSSFEKLGYNMDARVLSADDFGVPSRRKRTIIIGVKGGQPLFPTPRFGKKKPYISVREAFSDLSSVNGEIFNHDLERSKLSNKLDEKRLKYIPDGAGVRYEKDEIKYLPKRLRFDVDWNEINEKRFRQTRLQRLPWDVPGPTILTSRTMYYHPQENRYLTAREAAKCQSFPNEFVFKGSVTAQFRQIGNAVPPELARFIGKEIKKIDFDKTKISKRKSDIKVSISKAFTYKSSKFA